MSGEARNAVLRTLRHLEPPHKGDKFSRIPTYAQNIPKFVQPKDRIKYWNIVPGDHVKLRTGRKLLLGDTIVKAEGIVDKIDRTKNWVWLRDVDEKVQLAPSAIKHTRPRLIDPLDVKKGYTPNYMATPRPVHYSNLMLKVPGRDEYAMRLSNSEPTYDRSRNMFVWERYATIPVSPERAAELGRATEKVLVPWPKSTNTVRRVMSSEMMDRKGIEKETWAPWRPEDPVLLVPPKGSTSALSLQRAAILTEKRRELDAEKERLRPKALRPPGAQGVYPGFDIKVRNKPPPIAQPPTPAETIRERQQLAADWAHSEPLQQHRQEGGLAFLYKDYLDLAPRHGPASGGNWSDLPPLAPKGGLDAPREPTSGKLQQPVGKLDVDRMPIELMMTNELANYHGLKWRMRRYQQIQANKRIVEAQTKLDAADLLKELDVLKIK